MISHPLKCCSCFCYEIFSACCAVHVLHLFCFSFHTSLFPPLFLLQCFPLPGDLLPPVFLFFFYQPASLEGWYKMVCFHSLYFVSRATKQFYLQINLKNAHEEQGVGSDDLCSCVFNYERALHRYSGMLQWRNKTLTVGDCYWWEEICRWYFFFSWANTEMFLLSHSWMRSSHRTWRWPLSRASCRLRINFRRSGGRKSQLIYRHSTNCQTKN